MRIRHAMIKYITAERYSISRKECCNCTTKIVYFQVRVCICTGDKCNSAIALSKCSFQMLSLLLVIFAATTAFTLDPFCYLPTSLKTPWSHQYKQKISFDRNQKCLHDIIDSGQKPRIWKRRKYFIVEMRNTNRPPILTTLLATPLIIL